MFGLAQIGGRVHNTTAVLVLVGIIVVIAAVVLADRWLWKKNGKDDDEK